MKASESLEEKGQSGAVGSSPSVCELPLLCVRGAGTRGRGPPPPDLFFKVTFLVEVMSSPAVVLRLEKEASVTNLRFWGGDCETGVEPDLKQVGWGENTREVGRGDPLGFGTVWIFTFFLIPVSDVGRKGTLERRGEEGD